jgi:ribosomal 50S subunit-recycling heat shock protein
MKDEGGRMKRGLLAWSFIPHPSSLILHPSSFILALMRLDLFLKLSRLCPRRSLAQQLCDAGFVLLNGRSAKPAHAVKLNDELTIRRRDRETVVRVLSVPEGRSVSRRDAASLVEVISERELKADL